jgi:hypothetical protein
MLSNSAESIAMAAAAASPADGRPLAAATAATVVADGGDGWLALAPASALDASAAACEVQAGRGAGGIWLIASITVEHRCCNTAPRLDACTCHQHWV